MKKSAVLFLGLFCSLALFSQAQTSIETLKKENAKLRTQISNLKQDTAYLRTVIQTCELLKTSSEYEETNSNNRIIIEILRCKGDRSSQTVTIDFMISHQMPHQIFAIHTGDGIPTAFDNLGNTFECKSVDFQNAMDIWQTVGVVVPTDVRIKGSITFRNVLPSTEKFSLARFDYYSYNKDGGRSDDTYKVEIKNIPIVW